MFKGTYLSFCDLKLNAGLLLGILACFLSGMGCAADSGSPISAKATGFDYLPYYKPRTAIDLKGRLFSIQISDKRNEFASLECADIKASNDTEFAGEAGITYFKDYLVKMIEESSGQSSDGEGENIQIELEVFCPRIYGFGFRRVYGLVQFSVKMKHLQKRYCFHLADGNPDSPLRMTSVSWTRTGAMRRMLAGAATKAIQALLTDLEQMQQKE